WWDCGSKSGVESSAWVGDEGCVGDVERLGSICEVEELALNAIEYDDQGMEYKEGCLQVL
ncbi:hypothetical protein Tco_0131420, partial [Tanacetum coccineum]